MKKIAYKFLILLAVVGLYGCDESVVEELNYVTFSDSSYTTGITPGGSSTFDVTVYSATVSSAERTYSVSVDAAATTAPSGSYSVPASVTIPAGSNEGTLEVTLTDSNLGCFNDLALSFEASADYNSGADATITFFQTPGGGACTEVSGTLDFVFDGYGSECTWVITDILGGTVATGGPYTDGQVSASEAVTLCSGGCYTLTVNDSFGDGLSFPANGSFTLTLDGVDYATGGGNFGSSVSVGFQVN